MKLGMGWNGEDPGDVLIVLIKALNCKNSALAKIELGWCSYG